MEMFNASDSIKAFYEFLWVKIRTQVGRKKKSTIILSEEGAFYGENNVFLGWSYCFLTSRIIIVTSQNHQYLPEAFLSL